jgi:hypothetical protein
MGVSRVLSYLESLIFAMILLRILMIRRREDRLRLVVLREIGEE